jgi:hypothetical protein
MILDHKNLNDGFSHLQEIMDVHGTVNFKELKAKVLFGRTDNARDE